MAVKLDYVQIDSKTELPIRILRTKKDALALPPEVVRQLAHSVAIGYIRTQVIHRARRGSLIRCEYCGEIVNELTGELHEVLPRGRGGEQSLDNCVFLCHDCHLGKDGEHRDRQWGGDPFAKHK